MLTALFKFLYKKILKPILFLFNPEVVHDKFTDFGEFLGRFEFTKRLLESVYKYKGKDISKVVDGIRYERPVILSAGFDYDGRLTNILDALSFGGVEVGSVTFNPCKGNDSPRLKRAKKSKSIIVWKGLRNEGVEKVAARLKKRKNSVGDLVIGVSIAKTNDESCAKDEEAIADYVGSLKYLVKNDIGDYYTINISCPNAFGGETFTDAPRLKKLLNELVKYRDEKPVYLKMPHNLPWNEFKALLDIAQKYGINGAVIANLNKNYDDLEYREEAPKEYRGGLSGKPAKKISDELIRKTREYVGKDFTIIGVGGVMSPKDAIDKLEAGADLIMLITGMIFEGPHLIKEICERISETKIKKKNNKNKE